MNKYPYYGKIKYTNWSIVGAAKNNTIVYFVGPNEGRCVEGAKKGKYQKNWSEHNFEKIEYSENKT